MFWNNPLAGKIDESTYNSKYERVMWHEHIEVVRISLLDKTLEIV